MTNAYIVDGVRTPIGKLNGSLSLVRADDLAAIPIKALLDRNPKLDPTKIEDVLLGCANQAGEDNRNVARFAALLAGLPVSVPGATINRLCGSGMNAIVFAGNEIMLGNGDFYIAGGLEHMTRAPYVMQKPDRAFSRALEISDTTMGWRFINPSFQQTYGIDSMGQTAENVAEKYQINRKDQDAFAYRSHMKAANASKTGKLANEIVEVTIPQAKMPPIVFTDDEFIRPDTSLESLSALKPVFRLDGKGSVTAGNSSGINDGACALLLASSAGLKLHQFKARARILGSAVVALEPRVMGMGPVEASKKVLARCKLTLNQIAVIEINEAFAAQSLACLRELGIDDQDSRVNPNGGAIALGHPLGMSGARLITTAMNELEVREEQYALCTMCIGVGQGIATVIERVV